MVWLQCTAVSAAVTVTVVPCNASTPLGRESVRIVKSMDHQGDVREFLRSRRARLTPERAGIIAGGRRRTPGLRREELAYLAGMSVDYYARMERGNLTGVSESVLDALTKALQLDDAETDHLRHLWRSAQRRSSNRRGTSTPSTVPTSLQRFLDAVAAPVWVRNQPMDHVASNPLGRALYRPILEHPTHCGNVARFTFLSPAARLFFPGWERGADDIVATLRGYAGSNPHDKALTNLIGELVTRSDDFRTRWAAHNVRQHRAGIKRIHHPDVGDLELNYDAMELPNHPGWSMFAYTAEPGTPSYERLQFLGNLAVTESATQSS